MIGRTVGRYRILAKLGEGGMGSVWKAEDPLLGRTLALKFLPNTLAATPEARRRFLREAQAASVLHHPGIATVYDAGEADGLVYIAMLLVDGSTVSDLVSGGPLPVAEAVRIAMASAGALGEAHRHGVLHRDISGRNVMVGRDGRVVVVDFGLALPEGHTRLTMTGSTMGTAAYMAPEVAQGRPADRRSDLYSLGVVLYEMLTGGPPFARDRVEAMLYATIHEAPEPPSRRRVDLPERLERIVLKALAKDPRGRYQTAEEMLADLGNFDGARPLVAEGAPGGAAEPSVSRAPTTPLPQQAPIGRSRRRRVRWVLPAGAGVLTVGAAAALGVLVWRGMQKPPGRAPTSPYASVAVLPFKDLSDHPEASSYLADGISEALVTKITQVLHLRATPWGTIQQFTVGSKSFQDIARELGVDALVTGSMTKLGDRIECAVSLIDAKSGMQIWADEFEEPAGDIFGVQRRIATGVASRLKGTLSGEETEGLAEPAARSIEAYDAYLRGASAMQGVTREESNSAMAFFDRAIEFDPGLAQAYVGRGAIYSNRYYQGWEGGLRNLADAESNYERALVLKPGLATAQGGLIRVYWEKGKYEECLKIGKAAAAGPQDADTLFVRSEAYVFCGLADKAIPLLHRILELDPANPAAQWFLVLGNAWAGKFREAIAAGDLYLKRFDEDPEVHVWMGASYHALGELEQARTHYERTTELLGNSPDVDAPQFLGALYIDLGQSELARRTWQKAVAVMTRKLESYPDNYRIRADLAKIYGLLGNREMLRRQEALIPDEAMQFSESGVIACGYAALGDTSRALEILRGVMRRGAIDWQLVHLMKPFHIENLKQDPGFQEYFKELTEADKRLRTEY